MLLLPLLPTINIVRTSIFTVTTAIILCVSVVTAWPAMAGADAANEIRNPFLRKVPVSRAVSAAAIQLDESIPDTQSDVISASLTDMPGPDERDPLKRVSLSEIFVIGTMTSPHMNLAFVRTREGYKTPLRSGDRAGIEGFTVSMIDDAGISLRKGEKIIQIPVHNPVIEDVYVNENR